MIHSIQTVYSKYEFDTANRRVRRLTGVANPTRLQGTDGEWREYASLRRYVDGVVITWPDGKATITSDVPDLDALSHLLTEAATP